MNGKVLNKRINFAWKSTCGSSFHCFESNKIFLKSAKRIEILENFWRFKKAYWNTSSISQSNKKHREMANSKFKQSLRSWKTIQKFKEKIVFETERIWKITPKIIGVKGTQRTDFYNSIRNKKICFRKTYVKGHSRIPYWNYMNDEYNKVPISSLCTRKYLWYLFISDQFVH